LSLLAHTRAGAGRRPLVLLHGLLGSARNLAMLARRLVDRNPELGVVALDLTGHGGSGPLPPGADAAALAADVLTTVRALDLGPPLSLVGHSLGGRVALRAALREPAAIDVVTLLDIAPGPLPADGEVASILSILLPMPDEFASRGQARAHLVEEGLAADVADWLTLNLTASGAGYRWRVDRRALAELHRRVAEEDLWPGIEAPRRWSVRCVRGGRSSYVSDQDVGRFVAAGCPVATIDGASHFLHVEQPDAVAAAITAGLQ
jgi:pimeloyl-ACP methyl ester carboxylesterase